MVRQRRGISSFGCLVSLLIFVAVIYFGLKIGEVYWHFYDFQDTMAQEARFADHFTDQQIKARLAAKADSLGLPPEASDITVARTGQHISISADYVQLVELPLQVRSFKFSPRAEADY
jgi:hypothetical protein